MSWKKFVNWSKESSVCLFLLFVGRSTVIGVDFGGLLYYVPGIVLVQWSAWDLASGLTAKETLQSIRRADACRS